MKDEYAVQSHRLDAMAEVLAMIAKTFSQEKTLEMAVAGYVLAGMMVRQIDVLDQALDAVLCNEAACGDTVCNEAVCGDTDENTADMRYENTAI